MRQLLRFGNLGRGHFLCGRCSIQGLVAPWGQPGSRRVDLAMFDLDGARRTAY
jgi:hypothetical protein